jgi:hypothetical protein
VLLSGRVAVVAEPTKPGGSSSVEPAASVAGVGGAGGAGRVGEAGSHATALALLAAWNSLGASPTAGSGPCAFSERCVERAELATMDATAFHEAMREDTRLLLAHQLTFLRSAPLFDGE